MCVRRAHSAVTERVTLLCSAEQRRTQLRGRAHRARPRRCRYCTRARTLSAAPRQTRCESIPTLHLVVRCRWPSGPRPLEIQARYIARCIQYTVSSTTRCEDCLSYKSFALFSTREGNAKLWFGRVSEKIRPYLPHK